MKEIVGGRQEQVRTGYEDLSEEEMEAIMDGTKPDPMAEEEPEVEPEVEEDPKKVEDDEEAEEEVEEDPEDPEPEEDEEVEEDTVSVEDRLAAMEKRLELESLKRERAEEATKRAELMASKNAGRAGFLKQQLEKKKAGKKAVKPESDNDEDGETEDPWDATEQAQDDAEQREVAPSLWAEDRKELVEMAINEEGVKFASERAAELEDMPEGFGARLQELVSAEAVPYRDAFRTSSIKAVRKLSRSLMATAYATARIEFADKKTAEAVTRKAESVAKSKRRKKKAAISKSGAPKKIKGKPANYDDMSDEELENEFKGEFGHNYNGRGRS